MKSFGWELLTGDRGKKNQLEWLEPVFRNWNLAIKRYVKNLPEEPPYFYIERSNISLLAAGAWLTKIREGSPGIALEEYSRKKGKSSGRADLYICCEQDDCEIEAKQVWLNPGTSADVLWRGASPNTGEDKRKPNTGIQGAYLDAKKITDTNLSLGICFYPIRLPEGSKVDEHIPEMLDRFRQHKFGHAARKIDAMAWSFPNAMRTTPIETESGPYIYPGIIVALKIARLK